MGTLAESVIQDLRGALRNVAGAVTAFTAVAVLSLALGIGANTAIFTLIEIKPLRPIPGETSRQRCGC